MIRWWGIAVFAVVVGIIAVFSLFFLDNIIKSIIEDRASLIVGARVDIGDLKFRVFGLSVDIKNLQIADPEHPMRNTVQVGSLAFDLGTAPLLKKKIVIERMQVVDLAWNTPRKTSGVLPARLQRKLDPPKKVSEKPFVKEKRLEDCILPDFSKMADLKKLSSQDLLAGINLTSTAFLGDYQKRVAAAKASWEKRLASLPTPEKIQADLKELQSLQDQRPKDFSQLPAYLEKVKALQQKLDDNRKSLLSAQQEFQTEMANLKTSLKEVEKLREQDLKTVMGKIGIHTPSATDLVCVLFGRNLALKVNSALGWYRRLSAFMPAGKSKEEEEKPKPVPRIKGVDVRFPIPRGYPDFLLERAEFSVRPGVRSSPEALAFDRLAGELRGLTTHPALYAKPTIFRIEGLPAGGIAKEVIISGQIDRRKTPADDRFDLKVKELRVERLQEKAGESPLQLTSALLNLNGSLHIRGDALDGRVRVDVQNPKVSVASTASILADLFKNLGTFDVTLFIGGTLDQPSMTLSSSATQALAPGLENIVRTRLKGIENEIRDAIASRVNPDLSTSTQQTGDLEKFIQKELSSRLGLATKIPTGQKGMVPFLPLR